MPCEVLVDSGADFCILKAEIGEILGFDVQTAEPFSYNIPSGGHQVVGQVGFFDQFKVNFDYREAMIVLRPKR